MREGEGRGGRGGEGRGVVEGNGDEGWEGNSLRKNGLSAFFVGRMVMRLE